MKKYEYIFKSGEKNYVKIWSQIFTEVLHSIVNIKTNAIKTLVCINIYNFPENEFKKLVLYNSFVNNWIFREKMLHISIR